MGSEISNVKEFPPSYSGRHRRKAKGGRHREPSPPADISEIMATDHQLTEHFGPKAADSVLAMKPTEKLEAALGLCVTQLELDFNS
jgi:hypothetical protein